MLQYYPTVTSSDSTVLQYIVKKCEASDKKVWPSTTGSLYRTDSKKNNTRHVKWFGLNSYKMNNWNGYSQVAHRLPVTHICCCYSTHFLPILNFHENSETKTITSLQAVKKRKIVTISCIILVMPAFSSSYQLFAPCFFAQVLTGKYNEGQECEWQIPQVNKSIHKSILHWLRTPHQWLTVSKRGVDCHALPVKWYFLVWCWHPTRRSLPHAHVVDIE